MMFSRRSFLFATAGLTTVGATPAFAGGTVRIGYQKYGNLLLLKTSGLLEKKLQPLGWTVEWKQFLSGPPLLEALAAHAIDYGLAGEAPPIFAQAAGAPLIYHGAEPPAPHGEAILVLKDSPIKVLADLKGKKVSLNKGSNVHYLFVKALEKAGLSPSDVTPVYLSPPDGRAAFERGSVDAWVVWDPFLAAAQATGRTRTLVDGEGLANNTQFYLGHRQFTEKPVLDAIVEAIRELDRTTTRDLKATAVTLSPSVGLPAMVVETALRRQSFAIRPIDADLIAAQQKIADTFFALKLIPKPIRVADALPLA